LLIFYFPRGDLYMSRLLTLVLAVVCFGAVAVAQKVSSPTELDTAMKRIAPAQSAVSKAIMAGAYADARKQLAVVRQTLIDAEGFWVVKKKDDAIKMSKEVMLKLSALDQLLSSASPDNAAAMAAFKELGTACRNCHTAYREQDANQNFILKPGSVQ
jgi:cytochrome c556